jgi:hypothetical protein
MLAFRFDDIVNSFRKLRRFPLETAISAALALFLVFAIWSETKDEWVLRATFTLIVTFFLSVGTTLFRESRKSGDALSGTLQAFPVVYGIGFFFVADYLGANDLTGVTFFLLHLAGFLALLFVAPYLGRVTAQKGAERVREQASVGYSNYFTLVAWTELMAAIVGGASLALGTIAIGSVVTLFDLRSVMETDKIFGTWATLSLALIAPLYALIHFPDASSVRRDEYETNRFFSFLVRFVGIPAIFVYFVILYAYSVRVLVHFHDWPKGIVSWMVIGFSSFGYLVYAFAKPYEKGSKAITAFRKFFPFAVLPQILMLFYAIYLRIAQYDLTMNRYFVVVFGVWLTAVSIYFAASKGKSLGFIPSSLATLAILISFGPWSVFSLPLERQYGRLMHHLEEAGMLQNGKPVRISTPLDATLENSITSEIDAVCEYRKCAKLRPFFTKTFEDLEQKNAEAVSGGRRSSSLSSWEFANAVKTELNVRKRYEADAAERKYVSVSIPSQGNFPIFVRGFDFVAEVVNRDWVGRIHGPVVRIDPEAETLTIQDMSGSETVSVSDFFNKVRSKYGSAPAYGTANDQDLILPLSTSKYEGRAYFHQFAYKNPKYAGSSSEKGRLGDWYSISGIALLKEKGK